MATLLRLSLDELPSRNATYLIRRGVVEITTRSKASPAGLLKRKVAAGFTRLPLKDALEELSELTGASIITDPRVGDKLKQPVTATFRHDTSLGAAIRMLADMVGLKLAVLEDGLYITTPRGARALQQEQRKVPPAPETPWAYLLDPPDRPVADAFDRRPLEEALQDLSDETGASIVLDGRVGARARAPVTATFRSDTPVRAAVRVLADMAGLRAVVVDRVIYITTPAGAARLRRDVETPPLPLK